MPYQLLSHRFKRARKQKGCSHAGCFWAAGPPVRGGRVRETRLRTCLARKAAPEARAEGCCRRWDPSAASRALVSPSRAALPPEQPARPCASAGLPLGWRLAARESVPRRRASERETTHHQRRLRCSSGRADLTRL